jgi:glycosyltransferase involved in cell wall biosynthesis
LPSERPTREGARAALGLGRFTVASIGRLVKIKGLDQAIEALEGLDEVELLVAGAGPERAHLVELARRHDTRVRFLGPVFGADKETLLAAADAVLVPSRPTSTGRTEGVPTAAIEALARGIPVIATDTGGLPELLAHGGGLIVPADAESLRRAVERLRSDAALHARIAGEATRVGSAYTWDRVVPRFEATLTGACR